MFCREPHDFWSKLVSSVIMASLLCVLLNQVHKAIGMGFGFILTLILIFIVNIDDCDMK